MIFSSCFDIAVACFRAGRTDAEDDDIFSCGGDLDPSAESRAVLSGLGDHVVGGKQTEYRVGILTKQNESRQANGRSGVASEGLSNDLLRGKFWELTQNRGTQIVIRNNPETTGRGHGREARDGLLDHAVLAVEREQLLGTTLATERPEPCAPATSENYGIEVRVRLH